jgi:hypothetical protein
VLAAFALTLGLSGVAIATTAQTAGADGVAFVSGDVLASVGNGLVDNYSPTGILNDTLNTTTGSYYMTGGCFDSAGNFYVTDYSTDALSKFDSGGNLLAATWATGPTIPESCAVDAANNVYVGARGSANIYEFNSSGTLINTFAVTGGSGTGGTDWVSLESDQCTMLYTGEGSEILSYNLCTQTQNPDFATGLPGPCFELQIRPNGDVVVACSSEVLRFSSAGTQLQTYTIPSSSSLFSMNLDPNNTSFWTGDDATGEVTQVDFTTGAVLNQFNSSPPIGLYGLTLVGAINVSLPTVVLTPPTGTQNVGTPYTVTATITNPGGSISGQTVNFSVTGSNSATGTGTTNASGQATFTYTGSNIGGDTVTATFGSASGTATVTWIAAVKAPTTLSVNAAIGDFADTTTVSAVLTNSTSSAAISGETVNFTLNGVETCSGTTDATGTASCSITPGEAAGGYTLAAVFAGDSSYLTSSGSATFTVNLEQTALSYTGATSVVNGQSLAVSGTLTTDDPALGTALAGRSITFTLGSGVTSQTCSGTTNGSGIASCSIASVSQVVGPVTVSANFAGDTYYLPATASSSVSVFAPSVVGAFVIGDVSASGSGAVNFWGSQWAKNNAFSGGKAPSSMKGFVDDPLAMTCGSTWTTTTGNSSAPPATISGTIDVIVSSKITQSGSTISGTILHIVVVQVNPGYGPDPGHAGSGQIIGTVC